MPFAQALAFIPLVLAARLRGIERRTIARLTAAGANTPERAILLEAGGAATRFVHRRLTSADVLHAAGNDRYYFREAAYDAFRSSRRRRALFVLAALLLVVLFMYLQGVFS